MSNADTGPFTDHPSTGGVLARRGTTADQALTRRIANLLDARSSTVLLTDLLNLDDARLRADLLRMLHGGLVRRAHREPSAEAFVLCTVVGAYADLAEREAS